MAATGPITQESALALQAAFESFFQRFFSECHEKHGYGDLFEPLYFDATEFISRKAKRVRPCLFLGSYRLFSGEAPDEACFRAAAALELLHSFILIHDDVIDRSEVRRGQPTFHKVLELRFGGRSGRDRLGQNVAIVMGDILFALATETLLALPFDRERVHRAMAIFLQHVRDTGVGEIQDILLAARDVGGVTVDDIETMYTLKTTRYTIESPLVLGAILGGAPPEAIQAIRPFSDPIGLAFQILNDLAEFRHFHLNDLMFQSDLVEGKKTLLVREAFARLEEPDRSFLQLCLSSQTAADSTVQKVRDLILKSGAEPLLRERVNDLFRTAELSLACSPLSEEQRDGLQALTEFVRQQTGG